MSPECFSLSPSAQMIMQPASRKARRRISPRGFSVVADECGYAPPASGPGPVTYDHAHPVWCAIPMPRALSWKCDAPCGPRHSNLKPWVIAVLKKANDETLAGKIRSASRASCRPPWVPEFLVHGAGFQAIYFLETAKEVLLINDGDTQIRHIYMNVPHSEHLTPSYHGESVGRYERDELVVDTVGFNDKTFLDDRYSLPHTTQLHVIERFRPIQDGKMLEADFTVDDPGAFNAPWSGIVRYRHPGARGRSWKNRARMRRLRAWP